jgi:uncharacterized membrane protein
MGKHHPKHRRERQAQFIDPAPPRRGSPTTLLLAVGFVFLGTLVLVLFRGASSSRTAWAGVPQAAAAGADVVLESATFNDGQARFYQYTTASGREVKFFVMRSSDGVVRAAFDACDVCFLKRRGYRQEGDVMVCNNCGRTFPSTQINVLQGGCNPAPIERDVQGDRLVLRASALEQGVYLF